MTIKLIILVLSLLFLIGKGAELFIMNKRYREQQRQYKVLYANTKSILSSIQSLHAEILNNRQISTKQHTEIYTKIPDIVNNQ